MNIISSAIFLSANNSRACMQQQIFLSSNSSSSEQDTSWASMVWLNKWDTFFDSAQKIYEQDPVHVR